jgi:hypothetical protein
MRLSRGSSAQGHLKVPVLREVRHTPTLTNRTAISLASRWSIVQT